MLNYNDNCVCINIAPGKSLKFDGATYGSPITIPLTLDEIKYANNSSVFKTGMLEFQEDIEDELYKELRIDKNNVLKLKDIKDILLNPTKEGLQRIVSIVSLTDFDRVRGQFQKLRYEGYRLTLDIANIIETRTRELFNNQIKTSIIIDDADVSSNENARVKSLETQLAEMKKMLEETLLAQSNASSDKPIEESTIEKKKSPGRSKKNS